MDDAAKPDRVVERAIINRVLSGDTEAFARLISPHEMSMYHAAWRLCRNDDDAQDVVQEAILKAFKALPCFRGDSAFGTFLIQITLNEARMRLRKDRAHLFQSFDAKSSYAWGDNRSFELEDHRERADEKALRHELEVRLEMAIWNLIEEYRKVIVLRHIFHMPIEEIAQLTSSTIGATKTRLTRARAKLRNALLSTSRYDGAGSSELRPSFENVPVECARILTALYELIDDEDDIEVIHDAERHFKKCVRCSSVVRGAHTLVSLFCGLHEFTLIERLDAGVRSRLFLLLHGQH